MSASPADDRVLRRAYARALQALGARPRSEREIDALLSRKFQPEIVRSTCARLREEGLLDDARFARMWAESRARGRGFGPLRIRRELSAKGITSESVEDAVAGAIEDESEAARAAARVRIRRYEGLPAGVAARRMSAWLGRRGYSARAVAAALQTVGIFHRMFAEGGDEPSADGGK
jgi:regulatory protein